ncbi:MAG TPA: hypothetical protein VL572_02870 [Pyrinomonadaceae bacterium]|nr:hypothetical protein [Pyrinomonadaceae bacterium]
MMKFFWLIAVGIVACNIGSGQTSVAKTKTATKPASTKPAAAKQPAAASVDKGSVTGRTYTNRSLGFELTFPDTWVIPGEDFEAEMKKAGYDLSLRPPIGITAADRAKMTRDLKNVTIAMTAYRSMPGSADNAIVRISLESLAANPQVKDAVDYFDAMRNLYKTMALPKDFKYSETQAEQLGRRQFAFLDSSSNAGKKRLYATVRKGYAVLFSLSYTRDEDVQTLRQILSKANFALK